MFNVTITEKGGSQTSHNFDKTEVTIGRVKGNDIVLPKGNVSKRHSRIVVKDGKFIIVDLKSTNGTYVNGRKISTPHVIKDNDKVYIGDFILMVKDESLQQEPPAPVAAPMGNISTSPQGSGGGFGGRMSPSSFGPAKSSNAPGLPGGVQPGQIGGGGPGMSRGGKGAFGPSRSGFGPSSKVGGFGPSSAPSTMGPFGAKGAVASGFRSPANTPAPIEKDVAPTLHPKMEPKHDFANRPATSPAVPKKMAPASNLAEISAKSTGIPSTSGSDSATVAPQQRQHAAVESLPIGKATLPRKVLLQHHQDEPLRQLGEIAEMVMDVFLNQFDPRDLPEVYPADPELKASIEEALSQTCNGLSDRIPPGIDNEQLIKILLDEAIGLGPLEHFLDDDSITGIQVNGPNCIIIERDGQLSTSVRRFSNTDFLYLTTLRLLSIQGYSSSPPLISEVRFSDGTLVQIALPPVAVGSPTITVRKPRRQFPSLAEMIQQGVLSQQMAEVLRIAVEAHCSLLIAGPQGSGRTTLVNALASLIPDGSRIIAVESTSMLQLPQQTAVILERQAASPFTEAVEMDTLIKHALRMRPEHLIVDEIKGTEALDYLMATAGGASGSIGVVTALDPTDALQCIERLTLLASPRMSTQGLLQQISRSADLIVIMGVTHDGARKVFEIADISGVSSHHIEHQTLFSFIPQGGSDGHGQFVGKGSTPRFYQALINGGVQLNTNIFEA